MQSANHFVLLKTINYLSLGLLGVAYCLSLGWVGIFPALTIGLVKVFLLLRMEAAGLTPTARRLLGLVYVVEFGQVWLHYNSFRKGLQLADAQMPFDLSINTGAWYLAIMFLAVDLFALRAIGSGKQDDLQAEADAAESQRATEFVRLEAERERNRAAEAARAAEIRLAEIAAQRADTQSAVERIRAEKLAEAEAAIKLAEAEAERQRNARAEELAEKNRAAVPPKTFRRAETAEAEPSASADRSATFRAEFNRVEAELSARLNRPATRKEVAAQMGVSDRTVRNHLNQ